MQKKALCSILSYPMFLLFTLFDFTLGLSPIVCDKSNLPVSILEKINVSEIIQNQKIDRKTQSWKCSENYPYKLGSSCKLVCDNDKIPERKVSIDDNIRLT